MYLHIDLTLFWYYRVFSHDVTAAILVSQSNETAAMLVSQISPLGAELFSYANVLLSQPIFQCYLWNWTRFHRSVIVVILHCSANLVLTLSYLTKTLHLNSVYYVKWQAEIGVQIMDNLTCNFNRTRVLF